MQGTPEKERKMFPGSDPVAGPAGVWASCLLVQGKGRAYGAPQIRGQPWFLPPQLKNMRLSVDFRFSRYAWGSDGVSSSASSMPSSFLESTDEPSQKTAKTTAAPACSVFSSWAGPRGNGWRLRPGPFVLPSLEFQRWRLGTRQGTALTD